MSDLANANQGNQKGMQLHHLRSKSPQFDPMNFRQSSDLRKKGPLTNWNRTEEETDQSNQGLEIKTELVVSFRNIQRAPDGNADNDEVGKDRAVSQSFSPLNNQTDESFTSKNNKPDSGSFNMKIPIKHEPGKHSLESFIRKKDSLISKLNRPGVSSSEVMAKHRSPSVIVNQRTTNSYVENGSQPKKPTTDSNSLVEPHSSKLEKQSPGVPDLDSKQPTDANSPTGSPASQHSKQVVTQSSTVQKRSLSEKQQVGNRGGRSEALMNNSKSLIRLLMSHAKFLPELENPRVITKQYRLISAFAVTTHRGIVRNYNEDRVSVLLNVQQNLLKDGQTVVGESYSLFSLFDGHGGYGCCNYLKDNLHNKLLDSWDFHSAPPQGLSTTFKQLDYQYIRSAIDGNHKFSGSCSITLVVGPQKAMAINLGDSRALCSRKGGSVVEDITSDHKPEALGEFQRVVKNNGQLYRMSVNQRTGEERYYFVKTLSELEEVNNVEKTQSHIMFGPWRVKPGGLSVSRTFGDVESKMQSLGGLNGTVVCDPELSTFDYDDLDFVVMGCDGVFDKLTSAQVSETVWETIRFHKNTFEVDNSNYERILAECVNNVLRRSMVAKSEDNLTVVLLCFKNLYN